METLPEFSCSCENSLMYSPPFNPGQYKSFSLKYLNVVPHPSAQRGPNHSEEGGCINFESYLLAAGAAERSLEKRQRAGQTEECTAGALQWPADTKWATPGFNGIRRARLALIRGDCSVTHSRSLTAAAWGRWEQGVWEVDGSAFYQSAVLPC